MMNTGSKLILVLGIAAAVIFVLSWWDGVSVHRVHLQFHQERYAQLCQMAVPGKSTWAELKPALEKAGFVSDDSPGADGTVTCSWCEPEDAGRYQSSRLGVPTSAVLTFRKDGVLDSLYGK